MRPRWAPKRKRSRVGRKRLPVHGCEQHACHPRSKFLGVCFLIFFSGNREGMGGIGSHTLPNSGVSSDWLTPPWLLDRLGNFALDPCASEGQPWRTADVMWTNGGLEAPWRGLVWCNPPYGRETGGERSSRGFCFRVWWCPEEVRGARKCGPRGGYCRVTGPFVLVPLKWGCTPTQSSLKRLLCGNTAG